IKDKQEKETQNEQFVKDLKELIVEITNIENEYKAIQRMPKTKLEEKSTKQYYKNEIAKRERNYQYTYDDAIQIQLQQFVNMALADKQLVMQQLVEEFNSNGDPKK
ncbi:9392_t:CDS:2, partial [Racocetra persica]